MARWAAGSTEEGVGGGRQRRGRAPRQWQRGDESGGAAAAPFPGDDGEVPLSSSVSMTAGDESSLGRAWRVPRAACAVGRASRAAGGAEDIGPAAVVLVPHLRLMLPRRLADVAERQEPHWTNLVIVEELGVSSPLISMVIWAPYDSSFGDSLLCFCHWPPSIFCCALYFLSRSHDTGGDADGAEEDYEEELRASICLHRRPPSPPSPAIDAKRERERERERGSRGNGIGEGLV
uniref:Uncharacterized protein n=1 Tax=Oryza glumipatula TaxID=40148 RepID=A0A0E0BAF9_9ORYZ